MLIRNLDENDKDDIFKWRNDKISRSMFFESSVVSRESHDKWFFKSINDKSKKIYIGEHKKKKIGICRFEKRKYSSTSEISINMNPIFRGKGLASRFLKLSIDCYSKQNNINLIAKIKKKNLKSQKLFKNVGFFLSKTKNLEMIYSLPKKQLKFHKVTSKSGKDLYNLLKSRKHNISHKKMPSYQEHLNFINNHPYLHWYLIEKGLPIGSFYIQEDNSIGINIENPTPAIINEIYLFIKNSFKPRDAIPSKVPPYFFINVAENNKKIIKILKKLEFFPIQISFGFDQVKEF